MPQKLNKAGQMQDYIPKGNGDASGEYGTSNGTNKNFTTSDKKSSKANVITENKSVVVENKGKKLTPREKIKKAVETDDIDLSNKLMDEATSELKFNSEEERDKFLDIVASYSDPQEMFDYLDKVEKKNKANVINNDLTGKDYNYTGGKQYDEKTMQSVESRIDTLSKELGVDKKTIKNAINEGMSQSTRNVDDELRLYERRALESMYKLDKISIHGDKANNMPIGKERTQYFNEEMKKVDKILDNIFEKKQNAKDDRAKWYYDKLFNGFKNRKNSLEIWKNQK